MMDRTSDEDKDEQQVLDRLNRKLEDAATSRIPDECTDGPAKVSSLAGPTAGPPDSRLLDDDDNLLPPQQQ
jgi:hypothetical protein